MLEYEHSSEMSLVMDVLLTLIFLFVVGIFTAVGLGCIGLGLRYFYQAGTTIFGTTHSSLTDPVDPSDAPAGAHAIVTGTATAGPNGPVTAPFSGTDGLGYQYSIEQETEEVGWWDIYSETRVEEFELEGPADRLLVDPDGAMPEETRDTDRSVGSDESLPEQLRTQLAEHEHVSIEKRPQLRASAVDDPRTYSESVFEPGQTLYVYGYVTDGVTPRIDASQSNNFRIGTEPPSGMSGDDVGDLKDVASRALLGLFLLIFGLVFLIPLLTVLSELMVVIQ